MSRPRSRREAMQGKMIAYIAKRYKLSMSDAAVELKDLLENHRDYGFKWKPTSAKDVANMYDKLEGYSVYLFTIPPTE